MRESNHAGSVAHCIALSVNRESANCWLTVSWRADNHVLPIHALVTPGDNYVGHVLTLYFLQSLLNTLAV